MKLENILRNLNRNSIRNIFTLLKQSNDIKCKKIVICIMKGTNIFDAIAIHTDKIGKIILQAHNFESLVILGEYMHLKNNIQKSIISSMIYPFILMLCSVLLLFVLRAIVDISFFFLIITPFLILLVSILVYYYFYRKFKYFLRTQNLLFFIKRKINFRQLIDLYIILGHNIYLESFTVNSYENLVNIAIGQNFFNADQLEEYYNNQKLEIKKLQKSIPNIITIISIIIILVSSSLIFIYSMGLIFEKFQF